jgi:hypothetical protein
LGIKKYTKWIKKNLLLLLLGAKLAANLICEGAPSFLPEATFNLLFSLGNLKKEGSMCSVTTLTLISILVKSSHIIALLRISSKSLRKEFIFKTLQESKIIEH